MMRTSTQKSIAIAVLMAVAGILYFSGCASGGAKDFDTCKAVSIARSSDQVADGVSGLVCGLLKGEKRAQCLKHRATASTAAKAALSLAESIAKACGL